MVEQFPKPTGLTNPLEADLNANNHNLNNVNLINGQSPGGGGADPDLDYVTFSDESGGLPNSRRLVDGTNTTVDVSTPGQIKINASGGGYTSYTYITTAINYTVPNDNNYIVRATGTLTITLPAAPANGQTVLIDLNDANGETVTVDGDAYGIDSPSPGPIVYDGSTYAQQAPIILQFSTTNDGAPQWRTVQAPYFQNNYIRFLDGYGIDYYSAGLATGNNYYSTGAADTPGANEGVVLRDPGYGGGQSMTWGMVDPDGITDGNIPQWKEGPGTGGYFEDSGVAAPVKGKATLVGGTVTVSTAAAHPTSNFQLTHHSTGGTIGILSVGTITDGVSFVINSSSGTDTGDVDWIILN